MSMHSNNSTSTHLHIPPLPLVILLLYLIPHLFRLSYSLSSYYSSFPHLPLPLVPLFLLLPLTLLHTLLFLLSSLFSILLLGGRGVIDGIEKNLQLTPRHVEASRHTLYTYGTYGLYCTCFTYSGQYWNIFWNIIIIFCVFLNSLSSYSLTSEYYDILII